MPDCLSLVIRTPAGTIIHTGDWKNDPEPVDGQLLDEAGFRRVGEEGVLLLMGDSTNAEVPGRTRSESEVGRNLEKEIEGCQGRVIVSLFSSNIHRLNLLYEIAKKQGRNLCLLGRSIENNVPLARELGLSSIPADVLVAPAHLGSVPDDKILIVATGTQGESMSSMGKAAVGEHPYLHLKEGDTLLYSARIIPGNERDVYTMFGELSRRGVRVVHGRQTGIHASGHARQDELRELIGWVKPRYFMPIHGEQSFLRAHGDLAMEIPGVEKIIVENGQILSIKDNEAAKDDGYSLHAYFAEGGMVGRRTTMGYPQRVQMSYNGSIALQVTVGRGPSSLQVDVEMKCQGLYTDAGRWIPLAEAYLKDEIGRLPTYTPEADIKDACEMLARRFFKARLGRRPPVMLFYQEVQGSA